MRSSEPLAMDKGAPPPSIFVNDGSFMERFRQLQQEKDDAKDKVPHVVEESKPVKIISRPSSATKVSIGFKTNDAHKKGGKLAFSLKQKSKLLAPPVKLGEEEDEDEGDVKIDHGSAKRPKLEQGRDAPAKSAKVSDVVGNGCLHSKYMMSLCSVFLNQQSNCWKDLEYLPRLLQEWFAFLVHGLGINQFYK